MLLHQNTKLIFESSNNETLHLGTEELKNLTKRAFINSGSSYTGNDLRIIFKIATNCQGYSVVCQSNSLLFIASSEVQILYAIYTFAEKILGYCFFQPGSDLINTVNNINLQEGVLIKETKPLMKNRGFIQEIPFTAENYKLADWMVKNRLNYLLTWMKYYELITPHMKEYYRIRGIRIESGHHNFEFLIPSDKYYKNHPEYFAIKNGQRIVPEIGSDGFMKGGQLCVTNTNLRAEIVSKLIQHGQAHPELTYIGLVPNDGFGWCECQDCSQYYDKSVKGDFFSISEHVYRAERLYHDLIGYVTEKFSKELPDKILTLVAYINYVEPAPNFQLKSNMAVHFAPYWRCINHELTDTACPVNSRYMLALQKWLNVKRGGEINLYEYYMGVNLYISCPMVHHRRITNEVYNLSKLGVDGILTQFHLTHWVAYGMNYYFMAKAMYGENTEEVISDTFLKLFHNDYEIAVKFYKQLDKIQSLNGKCNIPYPRSLMLRAKEEDFLILYELAKDLMVKSPDDFRRGYVIWASYLLRFKRIFDRYISGVDVTDEIKVLLNWCRENKNADVFVIEMVELLFSKWLECLSTNRKWYHYNLDWEDKYIQKHESVLF